MGIARGMSDDASRAPRENPEKDVRELLQAGERDAVLVSIEGRTEVVTERQLHTEPYLGALRVIDREELVKRTGGAEPSQHELEEQASILDAAVSGLGG
jgi:hypothetical protein